MEKKSIQTVLFFIGIVLLALIFLPVGPGEPVKLTNSKDITAYITDHYCDHDSLLQDANDAIKKAVEKQRELPSIHLAYLSFVGSYACDLPKKNPLFIWGPPGSGKKAGLQQLTNQWRKQGRVVVNVDMSDFDGDLKELNELIDVAVAEAFSKKQIPRKVIAALDQCIVTEEEEIGDGGLGGQFVKYIRRLTKPVLDLLIGPFKSFLPTFVVNIIEESVEDEYEDRLDNLGDYMESFFKKKKEALEEINFKDFFRAIRIISRIEPSYAPIIIFSELNGMEILGDEEGKAFVNHLIRLLHEFEQNENNIPIIISSTNTLWLTNAGVDDKLFQRYEMFPLSSDHLNELFVKKMQIWKEEEIQQILQSIGGRPKDIKEVYRLNKLNNMSLDSALSQIQERACTMILDIVAKSPYATTKGFLQSLPIKGIPSEVIDNEKICYLLRRKVVYFNSHHMLNLVHDGMSIFIKECLQSSICERVNDCS